MDAPEYGPPLDPQLAIKVAQLDADRREFFEERAAVRQFEGGLTRRQAEWAAWRDTLQHFAGRSSPPAGLDLRRKDRK